MDEGKIEKPNNYTEADLEKDIDEWIDQNIEEETRRKGYPDPLTLKLKEASRLGQFRTYQNNFPMAVRWACKHLNEDGSIPADLAKRVSPELAQAQHWQDIYQVMKELDLDPTTINSFQKEPRMSDTEIELFRKIWIGMRNRGFTRLELI